MTSICMAAAEAWVVPQQLRASLGFADAPVGGILDFFRSVSPLAPNYLISGFESFCLAAEE